MAALPQNPRELAREVLRFCDGAKDDPAEYGTDAQELADLRAFANASLEAETDKDAKKDAYDGSVTASETAAKTLEDAYRPVRRDAYDTADDEELRKVGLPPHKTRSLTTPQAPRNLVVAPNAGGTVNRLFWKAGDDVESTLYDIYAQAEGEAKPTLVYTTTARKFDHKDQTPGRKVSYFVCARRRGISSDPSNIAQAY